MRNVLDVDTLIEPHHLAGEISSKWNTWNSLRGEWLAEKKELRNYVFATDTRSTSNARLPWSNSTTTPKLTQIYDNLKANYSAALFPQVSWMRWEADERSDEHQKKVRAIQGYMENKIRQGQFEREADTILDDFILYGNCFGTVTFDVEYVDIEGELVPGFIGPRLRRISPYDITFDPTSATFEDTPKIIRSLVSLGELKRRVEEGEEKYLKIFDDIMANRGAVLSSQATEKSDAFIADGFGSIEAYYSSNFVEILTFYGDIYDAESTSLKSRQKIEIVDRAYVLSEETIASWLGKSPIFHAGWRSRPDNLYAMGPLDNLVGMQYRIDHLENLKADVFDQIALPILKIQGDVEDFIYEPGARIYMGEEGNVSPMVPDTTVLQADLQIQLLENKMEEMAGAPRQAMGIRTPGEKTAFEVQSLQNSSSRIFQHKASKLEREFIEPVLNAMLESARRNMDIADVIRVLDDETGANLFLTITKADITARGKLVPLGARHFAERAQRVQSLSQMQQMKQDPTIGAHLSGKEIARIIAYELGEEKLFGENIAIQEQVATQQAMNDGEADVMEGLEVAAEAGL